MPPVASPAKARPSLLSRRPYRREITLDLVEPNPWGPDNRFGKKTCGGCAFLDQSPRQAMGAKAIVDFDIDTPCRDFGNRPEHQACSAHEPKKKEDKP